MWKWKAVVAYKAAFEQVVELEKRYFGNNSYFARKERGLLN